MKKVKLADVCELIARGISPKYTDNKSVGVVVLNQRCIRDKKVQLDYGRLHDLSIKKVKEEKFLLPGDILINSTGHGTLGRTALFDGSDENILVDSHVTIVRPRQGLFEQKYFAYLLGRCEDDFVEMATGASGQTELPRALLNEYMISYEESLDEQVKIVERLDGAFEKIDRAIELTQKNLLSSQRLLTSYFSEMVQRTSQALVPLKDVVSTRSGDFLPKKMMDISGEYNVIGGNGINGRHSSWNREDENIIIGRVGEKCGNVHYFNEKIWVTDNAFFISRYHKPVDKRFLYYVLKFAKLRDFAKHAAQPVISFNSIQNAQLFLPDLESQKDLARQLNDIDSSSIQLVNLYNTKLNKLVELKQSMLEEAFRDGSGV